MHKRSIVTMLIVALLFQCVGGVSVQAADVSDASAARVEDVSVYAGYLSSYADAQNIYSKLTVSFGDALISVGEEGKTAEFDVQESGFYEFSFNYLPNDDSVRALTVSIALNGKIPYDYVESLFLPRVWQDKNPVFDSDSDGNQYAPEQMKSDKYNNAYGISSDFTHGDYLKLYLPTGKNRLTVVSLDGAFVLHSVTFGCRAPLKSYTQYLEQHKDVPIYKGNPVRVELEHATLKSDRFLPYAEVSNPKMSPIAADKTLINSIGDRWRENGEWIEWTIDAPDEGMYSLFFRYSQYSIKGFVTNRRIYINGEVPFYDADCMEFPFDADWTGTSLKTTDGKNAMVYLKKGSNTLRMEVVNGKLSGVVRELSSMLGDLEDIYRRIIMVTGVTTDKYRDYNLFAAIPNLKESLTAVSTLAKDKYKEIQRLNNDTSKEAEILNILAFQIDGMIGKPQSIALQLSEFNGNIIGYAAFLRSIEYQPLFLDYLECYNPGSVIKNHKANFLQILWLEIKKFGWSFFRDYNSVAETKEGKTITMWLGGGRDQAQMISRTIRESFTRNSGIGVNIKLVGQSVSMVEAFLSDQSPDVAVQLGQAQPVDLAARGALIDLSTFDGFDDVMKDFNATAAIPFTYKGGVYGIPDSCNFMMMFYRKDIFSELGLAVPKTWDEFYNTTSMIQRHKMTVGIWYAALDAYTAVDQGMAQKNIFPALVLQNGGDLYNEDLSQSLLESPEVRNAFVSWTSLYRDFALPLTFDFYNRFRLGEMPLAINYYSQYSLIQVAAPEIAGLWDVAPLPGIKDKNGNINNLQATAGTAAVILSKCKNPEYGWEFVKWWASAETQATVSNSLESAMGRLGRITPANINTFDKMSWSTREAAIFREQIESGIQAFPEIPGSYYTVRGIDNAFRDVVYNNRNPIETLNYWNGQISGELMRKREELDSVKK